MKDLIVTINGKYKTGGTLNTRIEISVKNDFNLVGDSKKIALELETFINKEYSKKIEELRLKDFYVSHWDLKR